LNEMRAEQRPWIAVDGVAYNNELGLFPNDLMPTLDIGIKTEIIGNEPAYRVFGVGELWPAQNSIPDALTLQKKTCSQAADALSKLATSNSIAIQRTVFPHQTPIIPVRMGAESGEFLSFAKHGAKAFAPTIVGCIFYFDEAGKMHRTGFIFDLFRHDLAYPSGMGSFPLTSETIPASELEFRSDALGDGPAD
jgi:hypothetical protein